jgi:hypothetical protein
MLRTFFVDFLLYWETIYAIKWKILLEERKFSNKKVLVGKCVFLGGDKLKSTDTKR